MRRLTMFRPIRIRAGSAIFYPRNTPSMIVNNIPSSTVVQMAAFQSGDQPLRVGWRRSEIGHKRNFDTEIAPL
ncbi:MAG: hypothetical protein E8D46_15650 [Nitrospira sp.]|nr:MAG: hypothetical protein E8D46_15650 [Nitrospira sp.]